MLPGKPYEEIVTLLSTSLGEGTARTIVDRAAADAGLTAVLTEEDTLTVLRAIERMGGTAGLAGRLALTRLSRGGGVNGTVSSTVPAGPPSRPAPVTINEGSKLFAVDDIVSMLARSLGDAKAAEAVSKVQQTTKLYGPQLDKDQVVRIFDALIAVRGAVGTVARFAKARFLLAT